MPEFPPDLQADGEDTQRLSVAPLRSIDLIQRELDRIAYLRSLGHPWGSAVETLRDLAVGLEDEEFWDGLPPGIRGKVKALEKDPDNRKAIHEAKRLREAYEHRGWNGVPIRAIPGPRGEPQWRPTAANLSDQLQIVLRLLDRHGLRWKTHRQSPLPPVPANGVEDVDA